MQSDNRIISAQDVEFFNFVNLLDMEDKLSDTSNDDSACVSDEFELICDFKADGCCPTNSTPIFSMRDNTLETFQNIMSEALGESGSPASLEVKNLLAPSREYEDGNSYIQRISDDEQISDVDQDCTIFAGVTYLGAANINAPKSEAEIQRNIALMNELSTDQGIKVSVSVPCFSEGFVMLYDGQTNSVITRYEIQRILFYARGPINTAEESCFAFTWSHGDNAESAIFQCHVFRCDIAEAVIRVSACFSKAFQRIPISMSNSITSAGMSSSVTTLSEAKSLLNVFEINLEIKEDDGKGSFASVQRDKNGFRLKMNTEKQFHITIRQVSDNSGQLCIERCFGVLVAPGRHVRHHDMRLLEMKEEESPLSNSTLTVCKNNKVICASWDPTEPSFEVLNVETSRDAKQYISVAVDLVIRGIREPVRLQLETVVRICSQSERTFWYIQRKPLIQQFFLHLRELPTDYNSDVCYEVISIDTSGELDRNLLNLNLSLSSLMPTSSLSLNDTTSPRDEEYSDNDEPLLSGSGLVSKDCAEGVLDTWADVLSRWKVTQVRPKQLSALVRYGIPEALRGEVWQRLACDDTDILNELIESYRILITKESPCETVIKRDIARTFPAHDFFKEAGGLGQDSLHRVSKAYAVYDTEVGYCQGLSFLAASLLLHMPEEQAFAVLVRLMYEYKLRDLYKDGFDNLYLRLYQLSRLMEDQLTALWQHFRDHHIETHMFASQWFLTLYTARFPLYIVFHILDIFLLQGIETLFQVAIALLMTCKNDLLMLDFEGILKYFRVSLPKRCRTEESAKQLIKLACTIKVKKLKKYEMDFIALKDGWEIITLDAEAAIARTENEVSEAHQMKAAMHRYEEERKLLLDEIAQLKEMLKREVKRAEQERTEDLRTLNEHRTARQQLTNQLQTVRNELFDLKKFVASCENCQRFIQNSVCGFNSCQESKEQYDIERVRALELELAQTKLAHVEAECRNQDLSHQLRSTELELNTTRANWPPPWLSKTLSSIKEVANKTDFSNSFNNTFNNANASVQFTPSQPTFVSHIANTNSNTMPSRRTSSPSSRAVTSLSKPRSNSLGGDEQK